MTDAQAIRAVFFDLGGTLFHHLPAFHTEENLLRVLAECPGGEQVEQTHAVKVYTHHRRQLEEEMAYQAFFMHRGLVAEALRRTLQELQLSHSSAASLFCNAQRTSVTQHLELRSDTLSTLEHLHNLGICRAIVSNIDDDYIVPLLARTGLERYFEYWISSERAHSCKPHAGIFHQALAAMPHPPDQVLFVGDSQTNDVLGAQRLGFKTALLIADHKKPLPPGADVYIDSLAELLALVN